MVQFEPVITLKHAELFQCVVDPGVENPLCESYYGDLLAGNKLIALQARLPIGRGISIRILEPRL